MHGGDVLELAILGFLNEGPLPGHELRRRVSQLTGYTRPVSDGSLYPAINRLAKANLLERRGGTGAGPGGGGVTPTKTGGGAPPQRRGRPPPPEKPNISALFFLFFFFFLPPPAFSPP